MCFKFEVHYGEVDDVEVDRFFDELYLPSPSPKRLAPRPPAGMLLSLTYVHSSLLLALTTGRLMMWR